MDYLTKRDLSRCTVSDDKPSHSDEWEGLSYACLPSPHEWDPVSEAPPLQQWWGLRSPPQERAPQTPWRVAGGTRQDVCSETEKLWFVHKRTNHLLRLF